MAGKLTVAIFLLTAAVQAQEKKYCKTLIPKLLAHAEESGHDFPKSVTSRLQRICEKAITCTEEGCHGPFVRDKGQCVACSAIIVPFMEGELKSAKTGLGKTEGIEAFIAKNGIQFMLPQPEDCQKLGNAFCQWQHKLQECASENKNGDVPRQQCAIANPCKGGNEEGCDSQFRTINGKPVDVPTQRPWISALAIESNGGSYVCGGSWISKSVILTAKHCVVDIDSGHAGVASNHWGGGNTVRFSPSDVVLYPGDVDLAVIKIRRGRRRRTGGMRPLALPPRGAKVKKGDIVRIAGWGNKCENPPRCTQQGSAGQGRAEEVDIPVVCASGSSPCHYHRRLPNFFLAGGLDKHGQPRDSCQGDSGSTLVCGLDEGSPYACGVVSEGPQGPCGFQPGSNVDLTRPEIRKWLSMNRH